MRAGAIAAGSAIALAGCGGGGPHTPSLASLPLVPGAHVASNVRVCDSGKNSYCALELVVTDSHYSSPRNLMLAESKLLRGHKWTGASAETGDEFADESPGHKVRVTYATPYGDLKDIDLGSVQRGWRTQLALSKQMFAGAVALSAVLQVGSQ